MQIQRTLYSWPNSRSLHSRVVCFCAAQEEETNVIGNLGGRDIVKTGTIDSGEFYVKPLTKGTTASVTPPSAAQLPLLTHMASGNSLVMLALEDAEHV